MTMIEINIRQKIEDLITRARALVPDDGQARNHRHLAQCNAWITEVLNVVQLAIPISSNP
jgi:hypothetical protein